MARAISRLGRSLASGGHEALRVVLYSNLFLAFCAALWTSSTYRVLGLPHASQNRWLLVFVAAGVLIVYIVDRLFVFERFDPATASERHRWIARRRGGLLGLLSGAILVALGALPFLSLRVVALAAVAGALAVAYSIPVGRGATSGLKHFGLSKIFLVAGVWAAVTTILPVLDAGAPVAPRNVALLFAERFLYVFAITLPFDVRDRDLDRASNIRTIPVRLGLWSSRALVVAAVAAYLLVKVAHYGLHSPATLWPAAVSAAYIGLLLVALDETRHDFYFLLLWDGAILVQAVLALVFLHDGGR